MNQDDLAKSLKKLLTRLKKECPAPAEGERDAAAPPAPPEGVDPLVHAVIYAYMLWEASTPLAHQAMERLAAEVVDANELRVCLVHEAARMIGPDYPRAEERCDRLRRTLNAIFEAEHALSLDHLAEMPKRGVRSYLEALPGMPAFVAARVALLHADAHAFPLDDRLAARLSAAGVTCDESADKFGLKLERVLRAGEAMEAYTLLERHDALAAKSPTTKKAGRKPTARGSTTAKPAGRTKRRPTAQGGS